MSHNPYKQLAERLDALPNGYPPTESGVELKILEKLFTPQEAALAAQLRLTLETPAQIAERIGGDPKELRLLLKEMARRGLISAGRADEGFGYGLMPFAVGIYEMQFNRIDAELATLFEDYYRQVFAPMLSLQPPVHRVVPVSEHVRVDMEVRPYESASEIVSNARAWGVVNCICRTQKRLIGDPCHHPVDVCMVISEVPGVFDHDSAIRAQTREESLATLRRAAEAGLVHSVSNNQEGLWYICNCCTCSCGVLRGLSELGLAGVIARSAFVNTVDDDLCLGCEDCVEYCQFDALSMAGDTMSVNVTRCVGCGVCVMHCPNEAMALVRREDVVPPPVTEADWHRERAAARGLNMDNVL